MNKYLLKFIILLALTSLFGRADAQQRFNVLSKGKRAAQVFVEDSAYTIYGCGNEWDWHTLDDVFRQHISLDGTPGEITYLDDSADPDLMGWRLDYPNTIIRYRDSVILALSYYFFDNYALILTSGESGILNKRFVRISDTFYIYSISEMLRSPDSTFILTGVGFSNSDLDNDLFIAEFSLNWELINLTRIEGYADMGEGMDDMELFINGTQWALLHRKTYFGQRLYFIDHNKDSVWRFQGTDTVHSRLFIPGENMRTFASWSLKYDTDDFITLEDYDSIRNRSSSKRIEMDTANYRILALSCRLQDSGIILVSKVYEGSYKGYDLVFLKCDKDGNKIYERRFDLQPDGYDNITYDFRSIEPTSDNGFIIAGYYHHIPYRGSEVNRAWVIKADQDGCISNELPCDLSTDNGTSPPNSLRVYPNPSNDGRFTLTGLPANQLNHIAAWTLEGREIPISADETDLTFRLEQPGLYIIQVLTESGNSYHLKFLNSVQ